jgi:hypothetical protein
VRQSFSRSRFLANRRILATGFDRLHERDWHKEQGQQSAGDGQVVLFFRQASVALLILAVRSSLSQLKGLPSMARLSGLEQHHREDLAVGEALQPDVEQQPAVAFVGGVAALQREGHRRGDEVDEQEAAEVEQQLLEGWRRGGFGVVMAVDEVVDDAGQRTSGR